MRRVAIIGGIFVAIFSLVSVSWKVVNSRTFQLFGEVVPRVETSARVVALTFDDGPTPEATTQILSVLRERGVKATFFLIGGELEQHPELGQRIVQEGHELGNHTYSHERMILKTPSFIRDEIDAGAGVCLQRRAAGWWWATSGHDADKNLFASETSGKLSR